MGQGGAGQGAFLTSQAGSCTPAPRSARSTAHRSQRQSPCEPNDGGTPLGAPSLHRAPGDPPPCSCPALPLPLATPKLFLPPFGVEERGELLCLAGSFHSPHRSDLITWSSLELADLWRCDLLPPFPWSAAGGQEGGTHLDGVQSHFQHSALLRGEAPRFLPAYVVLKQEQQPAVSSRTGGGAAQRAPRLVRQAVGGQTTAREPTTGLDG